MSSKDETLHRFDGATAWTGLAAKAAGAEG